jgi:uncharacterized protein
MPHQCVRCGKLYQDGEVDVLKGCSCGARMFYFIKPEKMKELKKKSEEKAALSTEQRVQIEEDIYGLMGHEVDRDLPVILDFETIEVLKPGTYQLDLVKLFHDKEPLIYKLEDGKYFVDVIESFKKLRKPIQKQDSRSRK